MANIPETTLWLAPEIFQELFYYAHNVNAEVGGLGTLRFFPETNDIVVEELFLLDQEVHSAECELSSDGIHKLIEQMIASGEDEKLGRLNFWWHSHKDMGAFFSATDDTTMKEWAGPHVVALVINRKGEMKARMLLKSPVTIHQDIPIKLDWLTECERKEEWDALIKERVHEKKFESQVVVYKGNQVYQGTPHMYGYYGDCSPYWSKQQKSIHSMTDEEFKKEIEVDALLSKEESDAYKAMFDDWEY